MLAPVHTLVISSMHLGCWHLYIHWSFFQRPQLPCPSDSYNRIFDRFDGETGFECIFLCKVHSKPLLYVNLLSYSNISFVRPQLRHQCFFLFDLLAIVYY